MLLLYQIILHGLGRIFSKLIMKIDDKIRGEKMQYHINREVAKISALSSGKIDQFEYLAGEEILRPNQNNRNS